MDRKKSGGSRTVTMCAPTKHHIQPAHPVHGQRDDNVKKKSLQRMEDKEFGPTTLRSKSSVKEDEEPLMNVSSLEKIARTKQNDAWKHKRRKPAIRSPESLSYMKSCKIVKLQHPLDSPFYLSTMNSLLHTLLVILVSIPLTTILILLLPFCFLVKRLHSIRNQPLQLGGCKSCTFKDDLSAHDAQYFLHDNHAVLYSVLIIDGILDLKRLRNTLYVRVVQAKTSTGEILYPRLTHTIVQNPSGPKWCTGRAFEISNHVFMGPEITTEDKLQKYASKLLSQPLDMSKPPWELIICKGYRRGRDTVLIFRVHQCIADGMSLLKVLCHSLSDNQIMHIPRKPHFGGMTYGMNLFRCFFGGPLTVLNWLFFEKRDLNLLVYRKPSNLVVKRSSRVDTSSIDAKGSTLNCNGFKSLSAKLKKESKGSKSSNNSSLSVKQCNFVNVEDAGGFTIVWTSGISTNKLMRIKQVARTCVNEVIIATLTGALRITLQKLGVINPPNLKVNLAVDLRSESFPLSIPTLGTRASVVPVTLPLETEGAIPRIWKMRETLEDMKASADSAVAYCLVWWALNFLPVKWAAAMLLRFHSKGSLQYSSLPGPTVPLLIGGYTIKNIYNVSPPRDSLNLSVTVLTYADRLHLTVAARTSMPNARWMAHSILEEMHKQFDQIGDTLSHRRLPGEQRRAYLLSGPENHSTRSLAELRSCLAKVQTELQSVTEQYETEVRRGAYKKSQSSELSNYVGLPSEAPEDDDLLQPRRGRRLSGTALQGGPLPRSQIELAARVQNLKQEFTDLLTEIRRRRTATEGGASGQVVCPKAQIEEEDGEIRSARKRALSVASVKSIASVTSRDIVTSSRERISSLKDTLSPQPTPSSSSVSSVRSVKPKSGPNETCETADKYFVV